MPPNTYHFLGFYGEAGDDKIQKLGFLILDEECQAKVEPEGGDGDGDGTGDGNETGEGTGEGTTDGESAIEPPSGGASGVVITSEIPAEKKDDGDDNETLAIVLGVCGAIILIAVVITVIFCYVRGKRQSVEKVQIMNNPDPSNRNDSEVELKGQPNSSSNLPDLGTDEEGSQVHVKTNRANDKLPPIKGIENDITR